MKKEDIYNYLDEKNIWYEKVSHEAVYNMEELSLIDIPNKDVEAKNLFVCDDKKRNYYLIVVKGSKKVDLKQFKENNNTRSLSFASESDLMNMMMLNPGSVTPFGILNDESRKIIIFLDEEFINSPYIIGVHPFDNKETIWLKVNDLINIIKDHGNDVRIVKI